MKTTLVRKIKFTAVLLVLCSMQPVVARQVEIWTNSTYAPIVTLWEKTLIPRFQKETGITVVHKVYTGSQEMAEQRRNKQAPDVMLTSGTGISLINTTWQPLNRFFDKWSDRKFIQSNLLQYSPERNLYLIPFQVYLSGVSYNKADFAKAGLSITTLPQSWEALRTAAEKLMLRWGGKVVRTGIETSWDLTAMRTLALQLGETGVSSDGKQSQLNSAKMQEALGYLASLHQLSYPDVDNIVGTKGTGRFAIGTASMAITYSSIAVTFQSYNLKLTDYGFFPMRRYPALEPVAYATRYGLGITQWCKDPQAAWQLITWLLSPEISVLYNRTGGSLPSRTDLSSRISQEAPIFLPAYQSIKYAQFVEQAVTAPSYSKEEAQAKAENLALVLQGQLDIDFFLRQQQADAQTYLDQYWQMIDQQLRSLGAR